MRQSITTARNEPVETEPEPVSRASVRADAESQFSGDSAGDTGGHGLVTILCTFNSESDRRQYLQLTRQIVLPAKAQHPSCVREAGLEPSD